MGAGEGAEGVVTTLVLSCRHEIPADEREEEGNVVRMDWCPECAMWVGVEQVKP